MQEKLKKELIETFLKCQKRITKQKSFNIKNIDDFSIINEIADAIKKLQ